MSAEELRLEEHRTRKAHWKRWGPYLSERQWGTVREDYSPNGSAWEYFPHDQARSRAYRWGEDGIAGISDNHQRLCFAIALWNGEDSILKERLFGLTGPEGNHGEDVKEYYFYLDNTPTHSYMKYLYKYPQKAFPYLQLIDENRRRSRWDKEFELIDTGVFDDDRYYDVFIEYAKASTEDILIRISIVNRGPEVKELQLLPTLWFRNTWSWYLDKEKPSLKELRTDININVIEASHPTLGKRWLYCEGAKELLFTENETNAERLFGVPNSSHFVKDGINDYIVHNQIDSVNPNRIGTKASAHYSLKVGANETKTVRLRLSDSDDLIEPFGDDFESIFQKNKDEADEFYEFIIPPSLTEDKQNIQRQAFAGLLWSKQWYHYVIEDWLQGDPAMPSLPTKRKLGRNHEWIHFYADDILSMPDKWEYPWFAAWDLAFHTIPFVMIDPDFAKRQLVLLTREWYMHPNGQLPAYEWAFNDVNPPVHAWAAWRIYKIEKKMYGKADKLFLERVFQKLLLNFTWWTNRKDPEGKNVFGGGFLGLDNIGIFDRSRELPTGGRLEQADGTSWMAMFCLNMLKIALELAIDNPAYEDIASKFFEHFLYIADAMNKIGDVGLWNIEDGCFYDVLTLPNGTKLPIKIRSTVGFIPLFAIETIEEETLHLLPDFSKRIDWFIENKPELAQNTSCMETGEIGKRRLLSIVGWDKLQQILQKMLDENEFFGPYGIRSLSKYHEKNPYIYEVNKRRYIVDYEPGESTTELFGGNSNWRGPVWFPINFLLIESLQKYYYFFGDNFKVECPTGSGQMLTLWEVATEISHRLMRIFEKDPITKRRPVYVRNEKFQIDPHWRDLILFYEYFHGDDGSGVGASHQTGWTALMAKLVQQCGEYCLLARDPILIKKEQSEKE